MISSAFCVLLLIALPAMAQDGGSPPPGAAPPNVFPAWLGYAALGAFTTVFASLGEAVRRLWKRTTDQAKEHASQIDTIRKEHTEQLDKLRDGAMAEATALRERLESVQKEWREESERLLREQKDIFKEVMLTCADISQACRELKAAVEGSWEQSEGE